MCQARRVLIVVGAQYHLADMVLDLDGESGKKARRRTWNEGVITHRLGESKGRCSDVFESGHCGGVWVGRG